MIELNIHVRLQQKNHIYLNRVFFHTRAILKHLSKAIKKLSYSKALVVPLLMASCTPIELFYTTKENNKLGSNCQKVDVTIPKNVAIRKTFLTKQTLTPTSGRQRLEFRIDDLVDLKRRMLLNVTQGSKPVSRLKVWLNGQEVNTFLADSVLLTAEIPDMVVDLCPNMKQGLNFLEVEVLGTSGSSVELFTDGFMMPINIPGALHSYANPWVTGLTSKSILYLKFLEGMKVRLKEDNTIPKQLVDLTGISLYPLKIFLEKYGVQRIIQSSSETPEELDEKEKKRELDGSEIPNENLQYTLGFADKTQGELQHMISVLQGMPFFESIDTDDPPELTSQGLTFTPKSGD